MKKQLAVVLTAALLSLPVSPVVAMAETTTQETATVNSEVTATNTESTAGTVVATDTTTGTNTGTTGTTTTSTSTDSTVATPAENTTTNTSDEATTTEEATQAEETTTVVDENGENVEAGTLPDSSFYWLDELIEKIQVALTFDPVKKAELVNEQALERLAEAVELAGDTDQAADQDQTEVEPIENSEDVEEALNSYSEKIEKALDFLEQVKNPDSEEAQNLQVALTKVNHNNVIVLGGLLEKLPPQAAQKVALNIVRAMEKAVAKVEKMEGKQAQLDQDETEDTTSSDEAVATTSDTETAKVKKQTKKSLEEFYTALGVKKGPEGLAYGYNYKQDKEAKEAAKAAVAETKKQAPVQEEKEVELTQQPQNTTTVNTLPAQDNSKSKRDNGKEKADK
jgi:hypothetical protein